MALHVFNTLTRKNEEFIPARPPVVRIYTCGLTVYKPMHIGHARTYCFWDVFRRYLEYRNYHVLSVINYTDIDDRNMAAATRRGAGQAEQVGDLPPRPPPLDQGLRRLYAGHGLHPGPDRDGRS
jgi:cysteinyl-tRNA synthetase